MQKTITVALDSPIADEIWQDFRYLCLRKHIDVRTMIGKLVADRVIQAREDGELGARA